ncbi:hypothetical protein [Bradyrhizobium ottawaense]|nr:hypothetical protein BwSG10_48560 [Bradyrhizobium ottawaense]GMP05455.1 hypothetical protein BwDG23_48560 [Bradyrhizobium ottawaense]
MASRILDFVRPDHWSCGPTAVRSITGASIEQVEAVLKPVLAKDGRDPENLSGMLPRHIVTALNALGFEVFDKRENRQTTPLAPRNIATPIVNPWEWSGYPTIKQFVAANTCPDVVMGLALEDDLSAVTHTFVVDGSTFFDSNTAGEIVSADAVPQDLERFRVLAWYRVRRRATATVEAEEVS